MGLSQTALALKVGWPQQRVSVVESGARRLDVLEFFDLCDALDLSRSDAVALIPVRPKRGRRNAAAGAPVSSRR